MDSLLDQVTAERILEILEDSSGQSLFSNLLTIGIRYARIRTDWYTSTLEKRREMDELRTRTHNAFISACDALARHMEKAGENSQWRWILGNDRRRIGDFACQIHALLGLRAR